MQAVTLLLAWCLALDVMAAPSPLAKAPGPLPAGLVKAWNEAGATIGSIRPDGERGHLEFGPSSTGPRSVPAFRFKTWRKGMIAALQAPTSSFGLDLSLVKVTDADLKELGGLDHLTHLSLSDTAENTDAGLKCVAAMEGLTHLELSGAGVTDKGLKHLAGMKGLTHLCLDNTEVTDAGMEHLAGLEKLVALHLDTTEVTDRGL